MSGRDNFLRDVPWTRQPAGRAVVNRRRAFGANAVLVWTPSAGNFNLVDGRPASTVVPGNQPIVTPYGISTSGNGSQNERLEFSGAPTATVHPCTFLNIFRTFTGGNSIYYIRTSSAVGGCGIGHDTSRQLHWQGLYIDSPAYITVTQDDTTYFALASTYNRSTGVARVVLKNLATGAVSTGTGTYGFDYTAGDGTFVLMPGGGTTKVPNQVLSVCSLTHSNEQELRALVEDPWRSVFAPRDRRIFVGAVAGGAADLIVADATHSHAADNLALTQAHFLALADAAHAHAADNLTLTQQHVLTVAEASHAHLADELTLTQQHVLAVAEASHAHLADELTLTQQHVLAVAEALHAHAADNVVLSGEGMLAIADALHGHAADNLVLTQAHSIVVFDGAHAHTADNLALTQEHVLAIAEALHAHGADNLTLSSAGTTLAIAEALHAHAADNLALTQLHILVISEALHAHLADVLTLVVPGASILHGRILLIRGESRTLVVVADNQTLTVH